MQIEPTAKVTARKANAIKIRIISNPKPLLKTALLATEPKSKNKCYKLSTRGTHPMQASSSGKYPKSHQIRPVLCRQQALLRAEDGGDLSCTCPRHSLVLNGTSIPDAVEELAKNGVAVTASCSAGLAGSEKTDCCLKIMVKLRPQLLRAGLQEMLNNQLPFISFNLEKTELFNSDIWGTITGASSFGWRSMHLYFGTSWAAMQDYIAEEREYLREQGHIAHREHAICCHGCCNGLGEQIALLFCCTIIGLPVTAIICIRGDANGKAAIAANEQVRAECNRRSAHVWRWFTSALQLRDVITYDSRIPVQLTIK